VPSAFASILKLCRRKRHGTLAAVEKFLKNRLFLTFSRGVCARGVAASFPSRVATSSHIGNWVTKAARHPGGEIWRAARFQSSTTTVTDTRWPRHRRSGILLSSDHNHDYNARYRWGSLDLDPLRRNFAHAAKILNVSSALATVTGVPGQYFSPDANAD
jgi:hypothetical protein